MDVEFLNKDEIVKNIEQIDFHIATISKNTVRDEIISWFQQSPLHWLFILFVMKYYYSKKELSKQTLLEEINNHLPTAGKKTVTTEFKLTFFLEYTFVLLKQTPHIVIFSL